jgi:hypothetical protein
LTEKEKPYNKTVESGAFVRTIWKKGKETHQKTIKTKPSDKKVVLGKIGDFEVYVYPYDYPDKIFIGRFPISTIIDSTNVNSILGAYNKTKWFLKNNAFNKPTNRKGANMRRRQVQTAYNNGLNDKTKPNKASLLPNYNLDSKK